MNSTVAVASAPEVKSIPFKPTVAPKFNVTKIDSCLVLSMNVVMAKDLIELLDDYEELNTHEYALRERLRSLVAPR